MYDRGLPCKFPWLKHVARQWFSHTVDNFLCSVIIHSLCLKLKPSNLLNKALDITLDVKKSCQQKIHYLSIMQYWVVK